MSSRRQLPHPKVRQLRSDETPSQSGEYRVRAVSPASHAGRGAPRRYPTVEIRAVREEEPPRSSGRIFDDFDFDFDTGSSGSLPLDSFPPEAARASVTNNVSGELMLPPAPPWPMGESPSRQSTTALNAVDPHAALVAFAGFGDPPRNLWQAPLYALRVWIRRRSLRADLERARRHGSHDVDIYEASLRAADDGAVRNGISVAVTFAVISVLLVIALVRLVHSLIASSG